MSYRSIFTCTVALLAAAHGLAQTTVPFKQSQIWGDLLATADTKTTPSADLSMTSDKSQSMSSQATVHVDAPASITLLAGGKVAPITYKVQVTSYKASYLPGTQPYKLTTTISAPRAPFRLLPEGGLGERC